MKPKVQVLANDVSPFPDAPLKLVSAAVETGNGSATVSGDAVDVRPEDSFVGTMVVRYRVQDKTADPRRQAEGRIRLTVKAKPDRPGTPVATEVRDSTVVLTWTPPAANGSAITGYRVTGTNGVSKLCPANTCTIGSLTNDVEYTFSVVAVNGIGESEASERPPRRHARISGPRCHRRRRCVRGQTAGGQLAGGQNHGLGDRRLRTPDLAGPSCRLQPCGRLVPG